MSLFMNLDWLTDTANSEHSDQTGRRSLCVKLGSVTDELIIAIGKGKKKYNQVHLAGIYMQCHIAFNKDGIASTEGHRCLEQTHADRQV